MHVFALWSYDNKVSRMKQFCVSRAVGAALESFFLSQLFMMFRFVLTHSDNYKTTINCTALVFLQSLKETRENTKLSNVNRDKDPRKETFSMSLCVTAPANAKSSVIPSNQA